MLLCSTTLFVDPSYQSEKRKVLAGVSLRTQIFSNEKRKANKNRNPIETPPNLTETLQILIDLTDPRLSLSLIQFLSEPFITQKQIKTNGSGRRQPQRGEEVVPEREGGGEQAGGGPMGQRDRRHPQEQRGVRGGAQVASHRLRRVDQVLAGEAALAHLSVSRGGLSSPPGVRASPHLSGILFAFWVLFVGWECEGKVYEEKNGLATVWLLRK